MVYSQIADEDREINDGPTEAMIDLADLLPTAWPGIIVHVEDAHLQKWGAPVETE